ncbi:hypothetical protein [Croceicoccus pelagius]|uniref:hypothetical protein n=1 Tax=Croceicoccus pelagius TaxID=1703341 RepID=UPI0012E7B9A4|nr:hypothetical protein [Croceicoccus pelagius]
METDFINILLELFGPILASARRHGATVPLMTVGLSKLSPLFKLVCGGGPHVNAGRCLFTPPLLAH